jgi:DNA-directed RNA polymerase subunit RPC12/RpoP
MHNKVIQTLYYIPFLLIFWIPQGSWFAQSAQETLEIRLNRDFGYGGMGNDIQGLFSIHASGPEALEQVDFLLDGELMGSIFEPPFRYQFQTDNFDPGIHTISATGHMDDGTMLTSNEIVVEFVSSENARNQGFVMVGTILGIVLGGMVLAAIIPIVMGRKSKTTPSKGQSYGMFGGAVCPKCGKPFSRHWWGLNMIAGKLDRCPYCGKWSLMYRASPAELRTAEEIASQDQVPGIPEMNPGDQLNKDIDNSKYTE